MKGCSVTHRCSINILLHIPAGRCPGT
jgi:hypothetical protein